MNNFSSKILLFGEYGIIKGSKGLAIPFKKHYGSLAKVGKSEEINSKLRLDEFYDYLCGSSILSKSMNLNQLEKDLSQGLFFDSNIPQGYGIGSSGALCASIYSKYALDFERKSVYENEELMYLKDMMALMESFYHGSSSGLDCLISLIDLPVLIENRNKVSIAQNINFDKFGKFYLFDSGSGRTTQAFVHTFLTKYENDSEYKNNINTFVDITNQTISNFVNYEEKEFQKNFYELSRSQYLHFSDMIPNELNSIWLQGLETKEYYFKLCGAGGGGFFLIYAKDDSFESNFSRKKDLIPIN